MKVQHMDVRRTAYFCALYANHARFQGRITYRGWAYKNCPVDGCLSITADITLHLKGSSHCYTRERSRSASKSAQPVADFVWSVPPLRCRRSRCVLRQKDERTRKVKGRQRINLESLQIKSIRVVFVVCEEGYLMNYMVLNGMGAITRYTFRSKCRSQKDLCEPFYVACYKLAAIIIIGITSPSSVRLSVTKLVWTTPQKLRVQLHPKFTGIIRCMLASSC